MTSHSRDNWISSNPKYLSEMLQPTEFKASSFQAIYFSNKLNIVAKLLMFSFYPIRRVTIKNMKFIIATPLIDNNIYIWIDFCSFVIGSSHSRSVTWFEICHFVIILYIEEVWLDMNLTFLSLRNYDVIITYYFELGNFGTYKTWELYLGHLIIKARIEKWANGNPSC